MHDTSNRDDNSFYPYRVQQEHGADQEIPVIESADDIHNLHLEPVKKKKMSPLTITIIIILVIGVFIYAYNWQARSRNQQLFSLTPSPSPTTIPTQTPTPTPTQKVSQFSAPVLQEAYNNTIQVNSMRVGFLSDVVTHITNQENNESQELKSRVEGYFYGAADGNTIQTELRITQVDFPGATPAFFGQILVNNRLFIKRNEDNWIERDRSDFNKLYENQPIDATAYAYNMVDTLFTNSKALLRAIDQNSIKAEPDEQIDGKTVKVYSFQFSNNDYLNALQFDANTKEFTLEDARKILVNASISGKLFVDSDAKRIVRIYTSGTNFTQIAHSEAEQLGITTNHDITLTANLLDFNQPISLEPPN